MVMNRKENKMDRDKVSIKLCNSFSVHKMAAFVIIFLALSQCQFPQMDSLKVESNTRNVNARVLKAGKKVSGHAHDMHK